MSKLDEEYAHMTNLEDFQANALAEEIEEYAREINPVVMEGQRAIYQMAKVRWALNELGSTINMQVKTIKRGRHEHFPMQVKTK